MQSGAAGAASAQAVAAAAPSAEPGRSAVRVVVVDEAVPALGTLAVVGTEVVADTDCTVHSTTVVVVVVAEDAVTVVVAHMSNIVVVPAPVHVSVFPVSIPVSIPALMAVAAQWVAVEAPVGLLPYPPDPVLPCGPGSTRTGRSYRSVTLCVCLYARVCVIRTPANGVSCSWVCGRGDISTVARFPGVSCTVAHSPAATHCGCVRSQQPFTEFHPSPQLKLVATTPAQVSTPMCLCVCVWSVAGCRVAMAQHKQCPELTSPVWFRCALLATDQGSQIHCPQATTHW